MCKQNLKKFKKHKQLHSLLGMPDIGSFCQYPIFNSKVNIGQYRWRANIILHPYYLLINIQSDVYIDINSGWNKSLSWKKCSSTQILGTGWLLRTNVMLVFSFPPNLKIYNSLNLTVWNSLGEIGQLWYARILWWRRGTHSVTELI